MMGMKRPLEEGHHSTPYPRRTCTKRTKLSPSLEERSDSSDTSACSVSEASALQSSPHTSERTRQSSIESIPTSEDASEEDSESSTSSSSEGSSEIDPDEDIITVGGPKKPQITHANAMNGMQDLRSRVAQLLPQLAEANRVLRNGQANNIEDVDEDGRHIEMDLGLGVLEHKDSEESSESSEDSIDGETNASGSEGLQTFSRSGTGKGKASAMDKLMSRPTTRRRPGIQELG